MSAIWVVAGHAGSREYAKAEMLADELTQNLPNFTVTKQMLRPSQWDDWLARMNENHGWRHEDSPLIYRLLGEGSTAGALAGTGTTLSPSDRYPKVIGDYTAFASYAKEYYGVEQNLGDDDVDLVVQGNLESQQGGGEEEKSAGGEEGGAGAKLTLGIHNAASAVAYQLLWRVAKGQVFNANTVVDLVLYDVAEQSDRVQGVKMEIDDCILPAVGSITCTSDLQELAKAEAVVVSCGAIGLRSVGGPDLDDAAINEMAAVGEALESAENAAKVVVYGQGCNAAASVIAGKAPSVPKANITTLTRPDESRAKACVAAKLSEGVDATDLKINGSDVKNVAVWGGDSDLLTPDTSAAVVVGIGSTDGGGAATTLASALRNPDFVVDGPKTRDLEGVLKPEELLGWVRDRDALLQTKRKGYQPSMLVAKSVADHLETWFKGGAAAQYWTSAGVWSEGNTYGAPEGLYFSFPTSAAEGALSIVEGLEIGREMRIEINAAGEAQKAKTDAALEKVGLPATPAYTPPEPPAPPATEEEKDGGDDGDGY